MSKKQGVIVVLSTILIAVFCFLPLLHAEKDVAGKPFYTIANIWYEAPDKIYSTNYHRGAILPVGTKVTISGVNGKEIVFKDDSGTGFKILYMSKHSPGVSVWDHFDRYFSEGDPMGSGGPFGKFTKTEQAAVKAGEIKEGMSKEAVLMSYGYPPSIKTALLNADNWVFMENRFVVRTVVFKDNKVVVPGR